MKFTKNIPFSKITFKGASQDHKEYFDALLFDIGVAEGQFFNVVVEFSNLSIGNDIETLEDKSYLHDGDYYISDTSRHLAKINFHEFSKTEISIQVEPDFDLYYLYNFVIEPLVIIWSTHFGVLYLHASAIAKPDGKAILFPAWRTTGKTHLMLRMIDQGYRFLGDDYCTVYGEKAYIYPKSLNLFSYNFKNNTSLYNYFSSGVVLRLKISSMVKGGLRTISKLLSGSLSKVFYRLSELAEVSTNVKVSPAKLDLDYITSTQLARIVFLQKSSGEFGIRKLSESEATDKSISIIKYEFGEFYQIFLRYQYLLTGRINNIIDSFAKDYSQLVSKYMEDVNVLNFNPDSDSIERLINKIEKL